VKVSELRDEMHRGFGETTARFAEADKRFVQIDERFMQIDRRFDRVDQEFVAVRAEIAREAEATRRHMDIVAEQIKSEFALVATSVVNLSREFSEDRRERQRVTHILDDHELRLKALERRRAR
jgi:hypothetical protein